MNFLNFTHQKTKNYLERNSLNYDLVIIGTGFAAYVIAKKLSKYKKILLIEKGSFDNNLNTHQTIQNLGKIHLKSNTFDETIGGTSNSWSGNLCEYDDIEFANNYNEECEWPIKEEIQKNYSEAWKLLGVFFRKNYKSYTLNKYFKFRKIVTQFFPTRISKLLYKLKVDIIFNARVDCIGEKNGTFLAIDNKNYYFNKIILANGGIGSTKIIQQSVKNNFLSLNFTKDLIGKFYMNHPKFRIRKFLIPKTNDKIIKLYNKNKYSFIGFSLNDNIQIKHNLNNTYFRFHPRFFAEQSKEFIAVNLIFSNKKKLLLEGLKFNFNSEVYLQIKQLLRLKSKFSYLRFFLNLKIYYFLLFFFGFISLRVKYYDIEYFFELSKNQNNYIKFNQGNIISNINLSNDDKETFNFIHTQLINKLKSNHKINSKFAKIDLKDFFLNDAAHHIGGLNYKNFTSEGFVDKNCRLNNSKNIFICSSSLFPTAGSCNPTLTIIALAIKLSKYLLNKNI